MDLNKLRNIIEKKVITPTIINEDSNFVVVTYWWGRDVKNQNTSRPCISFFEDIFKKLQKMCLENLGTNRDKRDIQIYHNLENIMEKQLDKTFIDINAREYLDMIFEQLDLPGNFQEFKEMDNKLNDLREEHWKYSNQELYEWLKEFYE